MWLTVAGIALFVIVALIVARKKEANRQNFKWPDLDSKKETADQNKNCPYKLNASLLTAREASFFVVLLPLAAELELHVFAKPRIADFVGVTIEKYVKGSKFNTYFNQISKKHIDFLLCDADFKPVCGFEVDDKTHSRPSRVARDSFVDGLYKCVGLPVFHVWHWDNHENIRNLISPLMEKPFGVH